MLYEKVGSRSEQRYRDCAAQAKDLVLPLEILHGQHANVTSWIIATATTLAGDDAQRLVQLQTSLLSVEQQWLKPIEDYEFPVVTLSDATEADAICTIFETLNRTGVKLGIFDLLTARFYPTGLNLREHWKLACFQNSIIENRRLLGRCLSGPSGHHSAQHRRASWARAYV